MRPARAGGAGLFARRVEHFEARGDPGGAPTFARRFARIAENRVAPAGPARLNEDPVRS